MVDIKVYNKEHCRLMMLCAPLQFYFWLSIIEVYVKIMN
jgi:hypothetical protein